MGDAAVRYRTASEANDLDALIRTLSPDVLLVSPLSARMVFRGRDDLRVLLGATLGDAMVMEIGVDGQIAVIRPHLRPYLGLTLLALVLGPKLMRHPGVLVWAMKG